MFVCVCVCVCVRERERGEEYYIVHSCQMSRLGSLTTYSYTHTLTLQHLMPRTCATSTMYPVLTRTLQFIIIIGS